MTIEEQLKLALEHIELLKFKISILEAQSTCAPAVPNTLGMGAPQDHPSPVICHDYPSSIQATYDGQDAPTPNYPAPQTPPEGWRP